MRVLAWNVRGASNSNFEGCCKALVWKHKPSICCLMETKIDDANHSRLRRLFGYSWDLSCIPAIGSSGGVAIVWKKDCVHVHSFWAGSLWCRR